VAGDEKTFTQAELEAAVEEKVAGLKQNRDEALAEKKAARAATAALEAKVAELEQAQKAAKAGITQTELERLRHEVRADLEKQFQPQLATAAELAAENRRLKLDDRVKGLMAKSGARADRIDALFRLTDGEWDLTEDGVPMLKTRPGTPVEKFVAEDLKAQYPEFYEGSGSSGGGATRSHAGGAGSVKTIAADDGAAFIANVADIAKGKVKVVGLSD